MVLAVPTSAGAHDILVTWGSNQLGDLGIGNSSTAYELNPVPVDLNLPAGVSVTAVAIGYEHSLALLSNNTIMAWGANYYGQLGDGTYTGPESCSGYACSTVPVPVHLNLPGGVTVRAIAASDQHSMALLSDGTVLGWGENGFGELGDGTSSGPETCYVSEPCSTVPVPVSNLTDAVAIWAAEAHDLAVAGEVGVEEWGGGPNLTPVPVPGLGGSTAVAGGEDFSLALRGGNVMAWGDNCFGELGNGTATCNNSPNPTEVCETGTGTCPSGPYLSNVKAIRSGGYFDEALLNNGTVKTWGDNSEGELGDGTYTGPESCPGPEACSTRPVEVTGLTGVTAISSANGYQSLALTSSGHLMSWGHGFLGNGETFSDVPVEVCAVGTVGACPGGPYLSNVEVFGDGWAHSFALAEETPAHWFKKNVQLPAGGPHVPATLKGSLKLTMLGGVTTCKAAGDEAIWNPSSGDGEDSLTPFTLAKCKSTPHLCPGNQKTEVVTKGLAWSSQLLPNRTPTPDSISGIKLEVKCSVAGYLDEFGGTLAPDVGTGTLEFSPGSGTLHDSNTGTATAEGTLKLAAAPGKVTAH